MELRQFDIFSRTLASGIMRASAPSIMHNARVKIFPDGSVDVLVADRCIFRESGWESESGPQDLERSEKSCDPDSSISRSRRRARSAVADYARANDFKYFCTFTLDGSKVDRYDVAAMTKKLNVWLDNRVRRNGLKYVLVPELHKDGAVHYHALLNDALSLTDSGTIIRADGGRPRKPRSSKERQRWLAEGGHIVYNVPTWKYGFSSAISLYGDRKAAIGYVCKYISKSSGKVGGRWYYSGGDLAKPSALCADVPFTNAAALGESFVVDELGCSMVKLDISSAEVQGVLRDLGKR